MTEPTEAIQSAERDAEAAALKRLALAQIRQYPDPVLRMRAREVEQFDHDLQRLAERMTSLMRDARGVGLAATQVGVLRRVFVFQPSEEETVVVVNPQIVSRTPETETDDEGCLSLQGVTVPVERAVDVVLKGHDPAARELTFELSGLAARAAQHELDHLDGVLILDRTLPERRREALGTLRPRIVLTPG